MKGTITKKEAMKAMVSGINSVEGFDPEALAVEYTDPKGEKMTRLPVMAQMAWFRLKYPDGKISVEVTGAKDCFVAKARIYPDYKDGYDCYLAEATASRGYSPEKPSISPREWAQTAAVGIALRNAGFGLQFAIAGEDFPSVAPDELGMMQGGQPARMLAGGAGTADPEMETVPAGTAYQSAYAGVPQPFGEETVELPFPAQEGTAPQGQIPQPFYQVPFAQAGMVQAGMIQPPVQIPYQGVPQASGKQEHAMAGPMGMVPGQQAASFAGQLGMASGRAVSPVPQPEMAAGRQAEETAGQPGMPSVQQEAARELTYEEKLQNAMQMECTLKKFNGQTLGQLAVNNPKALEWIARKFEEGNELGDAARMICEYALNAQQTAA